MIFKTKGIIFFHNEIRECQFHYIRSIKKHPLIVRLIHSFIIDHIHRTLSNNPQWAKIKTRKKNTPLILIGFIPSIKFIYSFNCIWRSSECEQSLFILLVNALHSVNMLSSSNWWRQKENRFCYNLRVFSAKIKGDGETYGGGGDDDNCAASATIADRWAIRCGPSRQPPTETVAKLVPAG